MRSSTIDFHNELSSSSSVSVILKLLLSDPNLFLLDYSRNRKTLLGNNWSSLMAFHLF